VKKQERADLVRQRLGELYPDPPIPLDHRDEFTLLVAVLLSAQCTDKKVNEVTPELFAAAPTPQKMQQLGAEKLLILTDAPAVFLNWGKENQQALRSVGPSELKQYQFPAGSMGPKVDAVVDFAEFGGRAYIGALDESLDVLAENCGTCVSLDFEAVPA